MSESVEKRPVIIGFNEETGVATIRLGEEVHELRVDDAIRSALQVPLSDWGGDQGKVEKPKAESGLYPDRSTA